MSNDIWPNFIIPGAGRSGSTYIASILATHPDVFIPPAKEPAFFSTFPGRGRFSEGLSAYRKNFHEYKGQSLVGDASTVYMYDPSSPALIKQHLGEVPLIFVLRNPIERIYSNYWQEIKVGHKLPSLAAMIREHHPRLQEMVLVSEYGRHLRNYLRYFDKENMLIVQFEELKMDANTVFARVFKHLGLSCTSASATQSGKVNNAAVPRMRLLARLLRSKRIFGRARRILPAAVQVPLSSALQRLRAANERTVDYPSICREDYQALAEQLTGDIEIIEDIIQTDLSEWKLFPDDLQSRNRLGL